jgi:hypothetical protein
MLKDRKRQAPTTRTTVREVMASDAFRAGVTEVRAGLPPRFDLMDSWSYERGRHWALIAPADLDPDSRRAIKLFEAAMNRGLII